MHLTFKVILQNWKAQRSPFDPTIPGQFTKNLISLMKKVQAKNGISPIVELYNFGVFEVETAVNFSTLQKECPVYLDKNGKITKNKYAGPFVGYYNGWSGKPNTALVRYAQR